jgi:hypothetical protein
VYLAEVSRPCVYGGVIGPFHREVRTRVVPIVRKEWRGLCGHVLGIVVCEFLHGEEFVPIILVVIAVRPQVLFQCLVDALGLSVRLWMVCR